MLAIHALLLALPAPLAARSAQEPAPEPPAEAPEANGERPEAPADAWDVQDPPLPRREVPIDVREGTWINVDVSPDGTEICFDLLGDLYLLPIEGGEARPITRGLAWDMQPRFDPAGEWIAFTSDRGGGDNLWICRRDGSEARAVTSEDFRLVSSPAWTPDGEYLAGRKHYTSRRSLGAGQIWLWHRSGGAGVLLADKPSEQKDVGEPAFSPDGRYLYYSWDRTPGVVFEYSKDPHAEIYAIERLDRESGETTSFVSGVGGSIRPTPSPDGTLLAFVRRVRARTALFVQEVESGAERQLWDGLERDLQETWAIHGVYPTIAWTSDGSALVLWARGRLWRVEATSGEAREIPFHVADARELCEPIRLPLRPPGAEGPFDPERPLETSGVAPERFQVRNVRWAEPSPDGREIVFCALGYLWVQELGGSLRKLTADEGVHELFPSWTDDGSGVVYVAWSDARLGEVRIVPRAGGAGVALTREPGHYAEPVLAPGARTLVYRRASGGGILSPLWSREQGLFALDLESGEERRLAEDAAGPHFSADPERVWFLRHGSGDARVLASVDLAGRDEREHLTSEAATEYRVSPDGRWVAFAERFHAFVTPFPRSGRARPSGPTESALPQARVSAGSADFLRWSGDGERLHWTMGPQVFTRELREAFAFLEGAPEELPEPPTAGVEVGFQAWTDIPEGAVAFVGGRVVTMRGEEVLEDATVLVERDRIVAVGARGEVELPPGAHVVELRGRTLLPGLVDVHAHGPQGRYGVQPQQNWLHFSMLSFGVTATHDPSNDTYEVFASSELQRAGRIVAPRIWSTGTILYGAAGEAKAAIESYEDARFHLERMKAAGAFSVKSYNQPRRDQRQQVLAAARELGLLVMPEGGSLLQHNLTQVVDGHTGIEHAVPVAALYEDVLQLWSATDVGYTPTLGVAYGGVWGEDWWYQHTRVFENVRLLRFVPREVIDRRSVRGLRAVHEGDWNHLRAARVAARLHERGVEVQVGAHGQREGLAVHWELAMLVQGGMTPHEALRCGTLSGARYLGVDAELGSIEPGKLADLIVVDGDPLEDIRAAEEVVWTMVGGRLYDARTMDRVAPDPRPREPFWWER